MSEDIAIKVHNVSKSFKLPHEKHGSIKSLFINGFRKKRTYEKQEVLKNVSVDIKKGEFFGIVGKNGSGKSTLLKLIAGIYAPDKGNIQVNGKLTPFIELGVGFNPELTGRENVFLNGALLGFSRQEMEAMYDEIVEFAEIEKFMDQKLKNYSSGMQVRLAFSIAAKVDSPILVLDEVLAVGDSSFQEKCFSYFEELKQKGRTVVLVSHSMEQVKRFCTRAIYLKEGKINKEGETYKVADVYLIDNIEQANNDKSDDSTKNKIKYSIKEENNEILKACAEYKSTKNKCFVSLSIWKDGIYIGGISTAKNKPLSNSGLLEFTIDKNVLNPGTYAIGGGLFNLDNRSQLAVVKANDRRMFIVEGKENRRGGALKLKDTWEYGS
ncbi:MAG TPA: ABC transporter ATP-binding protein [Candidatus Saccharimonadales bacterium]|nr:ABC transporter ATP-binding protein [Candidatus Saccharimonadales bacterium]